MTAYATPSSLSIGNFAQICTDFLDGLLSDEEILQFRCELIRSPQARRQFVQVIQVCDSLAMTERPTVL